MGRERAEEKRRLRRDRKIAVKRKRSLPSLHIARNLFALFATVPDVPREGKKGKKGKKGKRGKRGKKGKKGKKGKMEARPIFDLKDYTMFVAMLDDRGRPQKVERMCTVFHGDQYSVLNRDQLETSFGSVVRNIKRMADFPPGGAWIVDSSPPPSLHPDAFALSRREASGCARASSKMLAKLAKDSLSFADILNHFDKRDIRPVLNALVALSLALPNILPPLSSISSVSSSSSSSASSASSVSSASSASSSSSHPRRHARRRQSPPSRRPPSRHRRQSQPHHHHTRPTRRPHRTPRTPRTPRPPRTPRTPRNTHEPSHLDLNTLFSGSTQSES